MVAGSPTAVKRASVSTLSFTDLIAASLVNTDTAGPFSFNVSGLANGTYTLTAKEANTTTMVVGGVLMAARVLVVPTQMEASGKSSTSAATCAIRVAIP